MKIITCTGFYGTGSSAVTDIMQDCDHVLCKGDYEIRLPHDPYGISDLEYNLIDNPNRHNTSNAIKKFKWIVDFLSGNRFIKRYEGYFNGQFKALSYQYIDEISEFQYFGKWHYDWIERGLTFWTINRIYNKAFVILKKIFRRENEVGHDLLPKDELAYAGTGNKKVFYEATKRYTRNLFEVLNPEKKPFLMLDQLVPPNNFVRFNNYFDNLKIIVVDRDPRDIFLLEKKVWFGTVVPYYDVETFCKWYVWTRDMYEKSVKPENVLKIQFEDLIYRSDETIKQVLDFVGIDKKDYHMHHFDPEKSRKNTRLWEKYPEEMDAIRQIEATLGKYCYVYN